MAFTNFPFPIPPRPPSCSAAHPCPSSGGWDSDDSAIEHTSPLHADSQSMAQGYAAHVLSLEMPNMQSLASPTRGAVTVSAKSRRHAPARDDSRPRHGGGGGSGDFSQTLSSLPTAHNSSSPRRGPSSAARVRMMREMSASHGATLFSSSGRAALALNTAQQPLIIDSKHANNNQTNNASSSSTTASALTSSPSSTVDPSSSVVSTTFKSSPLVVSRRQRTHTSALTTHNITPSNHNGASSQVATNAAAANNTSSSLSIPQSTLQTSSSLLTSIQSSSSSALHDQAVSPTKHSYNSATHARKSTVTISFPKHNSITPKPQSSFHSLPASCPISSSSHPKRRHTTVNSSIPHTTQGDDAATLPIPPLHLNIDLKSLISTQLPVRAIKHTRKRQSPERQRQLKEQQQSQSGVTSHTRYAIYPLPTDEEVEEMKRESAQLDSTVPLLLASPAAVPSPVPPSPPTPPSPPVASQPLAQWHSVSGRCRSPRGRVHVTPSIDGALAATPWKGEEDIQSIQLSSQQQQTQGAPSLSVIDTLVANERNSHLPDATPQTYLCYLPVHHLSPHPTTRFGAPVSAAERRLREWNSSKKYVADGRRPEDDELPPPQTPQPPPEQPQPHQFRVVYPPHTSSSQNSRPPTAPSTLSSSSHLDESIIDTPPQTELESVTLTKPGMRMVYDETGRKLTSTLSSSGLSQSSNSQASLSARLASDKSTHSIHSLHRHSSHTLKPYEAEFKLGNAPPKDWRHELGLIEKEKESTQEKSVKRMMDAILFSSNSAASPQSLPSSTAAVSLAMIDPTINIDVERPDVIEWEFFTPNEKVEYLLREKGINPEQYWQQREELELRAHIDGRDELSRFSGFDSLEEFLNVRDKVQTDRRHHLLDTDHLDIKPLDRSSEATSSMDISTAQPQDPLPTFNNTGNHSVVGSLLYQGRRSKQNPVIGTRTYNIPTAHGDQQIIMRPTPVVNTKQTRVRSTKGLVHEVNVMDTIRSHLTRQAEQACRNIHAHLDVLIDQQKQAQREARSTLTITSMDDDGEQPPRAPSPTKAIAARVEKQDYFVEFPQPVSPPHPYTPSLASSSLSARAQYHKQRAGRADPWCRDPRMRIANTPILVTDKMEHGYITKQYVTGKSTLKPHDTSSHIVSSTVAASAPRALTSNIVAHQSSAHQSELQSVLSVIERGYASSHSVGTLPRPVKQGGTLPLEWNQEASNEDYLRKYAQHTEEHALPEFDKGLYEEAEEKHVKIVNERIETDIQIKLLEEEEKFHQIELEKKRREALVNSKLKKPKLANIALDG